ncbi:Uncharacterized protein BM_BM14310 [Brugia malayi]|uniref:Bm14310 n=1 Tax=Brugia malayi TaxID=6279 RepID=A0A0K0J0T6_BRUMA|nr:Uncharacterized protein BM_BM14310 [Brugia malayi]CDQ01183.1 Bm14310 [Brugia malayi]VIO94667.1 Uncharacterized protein BM_BM14310 [Brugia malayi]
MKIEALENVLLTFDRVQHTLIKLLENICAEYLNN